MTKEAREITNSLWNRRKNYTLILRMAYLLSHRYVRVHWGNDFKSSRIWNGAEEDFHTLLYILLTVTKNSSPETADRRVSSKSGGFKCLVMRCKSMPILLHFSSAVGLGVATKWLLHSSRVCLWGVGHPSSLLRRNTRYHRGMPKPPSLGHTGGFVQPVQRRHTKKQMLKDRRNSFRWLTPLLLCREEIIIRNNREHLISCWLTTLDPCSFLSMRLSRFLHRRRHRVLDAR